MKKRDLIRIYRKILRRPYTITAILLLLTSFLSFQTNEGLVLGEFTDLAFNQQSAISNQQSKTPAVLPVSIDQSQIPTGVTAKSIMILDPTTHTTLYAQSANLRLPIASLTKIAAALVTLDNMDLSQIAIVPNDIVKKAQGSLMGLVAGEKITVENLLWGMLLNSGNDAAFVLAMNFPGGYHAFVEKMNELASFLRLADTKFTNPMGFDEKEHFSSAYDLAILASFALRNPLFAQMVGTIEKTVISESFVPSTRKSENQPLENQQHWHNLKNTNELLGTINGVTGVKTGYTQKAGECMIVSAEYNNQDIIIVILGSENRLEDAKKLIDWVERNFSL